MVQGNPGKRALNKREPKPKSDAPTMPGHLSPTAKTVWKRTVKIMKDMKVLTVADGDAIAVYSVSFARWVEAEQFLKKHGTTYPLRDKSGNVRFLQTFPQVAIANQLAKTVRNYQQEFGLTPSSRSSITTHGERDANPFTTWLSKNG